MTRTLPPSPLASSGAADRIVAHYGSAPGELAACVRSVGVVERGDLVVLSVIGEGPALDRVAAHLTRSSLAVGGGAPVGDTWWCRPAIGRLLVLAPAGHADRWHRLLDAECRRRHGVQIDHDCALEVVGLVGRRVTELLRHLGVHEGDPLRVAPCMTTQVDGRRVTWLLESSSSVMACVPAEHHDDLLRGLLRVGQRLGLARVGQQAHARYRLLVQREASRHVDA